MRNQPPSHLLAGDPDVHLAVPKIQQNVIAHHSAAALLKRNHGRTPLNPADGPVRNDLAAVQAKAQEKTRFFRQVSKDAVANIANQIRTGGGPVVAALQEGYSPAQ